MTYQAIKCPCGHRGCNNWMVEPVAAIQGVGFTEEQARAVADLLNEMERPDPPYVPPLCKGGVDLDTMGPVCRKCGATDNDTCRGAP